jgi:APA family basic amino acid/polyamine antiporter
MVGQPGRPQLRRALGLREAVALGIGGTIGGGIFVLIGPATAMAGPGVLVSFLIGFLAALAIALPYAELACRYPLAGGGYAFTKEVLGRRFGFFMGW